ncbi:MAG: WecB/TagA/CpsF family glycosyltransferase [Treponema sp.]|nr:WecB/TagA/CpsF family glycosyltransferase [Treponema sp.]
MDAKTKMNAKGSTSDTSADRSAPCERVNVLKIPIDIVAPEQLTDFIYWLLSSVPSPSKKGKNIVLLSVWDLLKARRNKEYRSFILNADLVIPISKSLVSGARFLKRKTPYRYMPFNFVISLLGILENREYTAYLLGGKLASLKKAEGNLRRTFPQLRIVGRFPGSFKKQEEASLMEAISKAAPHLLLAGKGIRGGELWIKRNDEFIGKGLRLWCSDLFDVFAEIKKRPAEKTFELGLESLGYCMKNPFKFLRIFPYFRYKFLLLIYKIFKIGG